MERASPSIQVQRRPIGRSQDPPHATVAQSEYCPPTSDGCHLCLPKFADAESFPPSPRLSQAPTAAAFSTPSHKYTAHRIVRPSLEQRHGFGRHACQTYHGRRETAPSLQWSLPLLRGRKPLCRILPRQEGSSGCRHYRLGKRVGLDSSEEWR